MADDRLAARLRGFGPLGVPLHPDGVDDALNNFFCILLEVVAMKNREVFVVSRRKSNGFYGFPNNFIEQQLGVMATSRNWSTVTKIVGQEREP